MNSVAIYFFIFLLESILCRVGYKKQNKIYIIFGMLILVLFVGFRYEVGTDYNDYLKVFDEIKRLSFSELINYKWEIGFKVLFKLISLLFNDGKIIFIFIAFLNIYPIFKTNELYNYKYLSLSITMFCFLFLPFCMNGMRQGVAMSFILYSTFLLFNDCKKKSIIWLIFAFLFHKSSIIFFPFYIIIYSGKTDSKKIKKRITIMAIFISIIILFFLKNIFDSFEVNIYSSYVNSIGEKSISLRSLLFHLPIIIIILSSVKKDKLSSLFKTLLTTGYVLMIVGSAGGYIGRIASYFTIFEIILVPHIISNIKDNSMRVLVRFCLIMYVIIYFIYCYCMLGYQEIIPYQSWIFN